MIKFETILKESLYQNNNIILENYIVSEGISFDKIKKIGTALTVGAAMSASLGSVAKANDWDKTDYALLGGTYAAIYADNVSTKAVLKKGGVETNPLIGKHPSGQDLDKAALIAAGSATAAALAIPAEYRKAFLTGWMTLEASLANHNSKLNVKNDSQDFKRQTQNSVATAALAAALTQYLPKNFDVNISNSNNDKKVSFGYSHNF